MTDGLEDEYNPMSPLVDTLPSDTKMSISPAVGISAMALGLSIKYHDIGTIQEGTLYQAIKAEGKQILPLNLQMVLETAKLFEAHIMSAPSRLTNMVMDALVESFAGEQDGEKVADFVDEDSKWLDDVDEYGEPKPIVCKFTIDGTEHTHNAWTITGAEVHALANIPPGKKLMLRSDTIDVQIFNIETDTIDLDVDMLREFYSE